MTGSKMSQFFHNVLHLRSSSSSSSTGNDHRRTGSTGSDGGKTQSKDSTTAAAATSAPGRDAALNKAPSGSNHSSGRPLVLDVQHTNGSTAAVAKQQLHQIQHQQQQQQQQRVQETQPGLESAQPSEHHSAPLPSPGGEPSCAVESLSLPAAAAAATAQQSTAAAAVAGTPATPTAAAAAAATTPKGTSSGSSVSFSPGQRSMYVNVNSNSGGRAAGLSRRSMGALSLSHGVGDAFKVRVGICAMDKKAKSKPMREIIQRLEGPGEFEIINFGDDLILNKPITEWPKVDCLMSWYSDGFPLAKAQAYADATRPFLINDLHMQDALHDRRAVYRLLEEHGIAVPFHIVVSRDGLPPGEDPPGFIEEEDYVELDGVRIDKPFVEKPASGEDHNIYIYYPHSMGGGVKRLFRKIDNKSSCYDPHHPGTVRRDGSYIYEEFLATGGTDVKVYTVGPRYAHAEARKSPVVDGRVLRTPDGKEMRFPVLLNPAEKEISRTVCLAFGQKVCGFDLLRSEKGGSYVCDVNGWSFVKNSRKYYDDAAGILRSTILAALAPHRLALAPPSGSPLSFSLGFSPIGQQPGAGDAAAAAAAAVAAGGYDEESLGMMHKSASLQEMASLMAELSAVDLKEATRTDERSAREELRCVLAVVRHGDRTPKQKLKVRVRQPALLALFHKHCDSKGKQAKLKSPAQLQELLDICRSTLEELAHPPPPGLTEEEIEQREDLKEKLHIVKTVLEQGGQFSGINRKVQLKPLTWSTPAATEQQQQQGQQQQQQQEAKPVLQEALLILKYGGVLTHAGRAQAEELGKVFRLVMYPRYGSTGGGLLRLHSTYRHDLKIYSSDEGRVQVSAAAFTKGLLALEGSSLTPILVSLISKDASMLDAFGKGASEDIRRAKQILYTAMTWDPTTSTSNNFTPHYSRSATPAPTPLLTSPPLSPRSMSRASSSGGGAAASGGGGSNSAGSSSAATAAAAGSAEQQQQQGAEVQGPSAACAGQPADSSTAAVATPAAAAAVQLQASRSSQDGSSAAAALPPTPAAAAAGAANPGSVGTDIVGMPENPLQHLKRLNELMKLMVEQLRQLVLAEKRHGMPSNASSSAQDLTQAAAAAAADCTATAGSGGSSSSTLLISMANLTTPPHPAARAAAAASSVSSPPRPSTAPAGGAAAAAAAGSSSFPGTTGSDRYSSLSTDPQDWHLEAEHPCSGERLLLMYDRWQKLAKSFCKKGRYDISKVPDIYDSAKYDALHNAHLGFGATLEELYEEAKILADAVIPNEYGTDPASKLAIGSKIATELLAKLLDDLRLSKEESLATLTEAEKSGITHHHANTPLSRKSMPLLRQAGGTADSTAAAGGTAAGSTNEGSTTDMAMVTRAASAGAALSAAAAAKDGSDSDHAGGDEAEVEGFIDGDESLDAEPELIHRLCPTYASDINSPLRHVRTRIYFTSESHMHSLINLLRYCHLRHQLLPGGSSSSNGNSSAAAAAAAGDGSSNSTAGVAAAARANSVDVSAAEAGLAAAGNTGGSVSSSSNITAAAAAPESLISDEAFELLKATTELDYLTHLVFRLYENKSVTADHPERFRIEILFCPGTAYDPTQVIPPRGNHTLPPAPRVDLHKGDGGTLAHFEKLLKPFAAKRRAAAQPQAAGNGK